MPLSADERAILELLLVRKREYGQIDAVLGAEPGAARARAHAAIERLGGAGLDPAVCDYLLGRADAAEAAKARGALRADPAANALARRVTGALAAELGPDASPPAVPPARHSRTGALIGIALAVLALGAVVLALTGAFSDEKEEPQPVAEEGPAAVAAPEPIRLELEPVGDAGGIGTALIGVTEAREPFLELDLSGLEPAPEGSLHLLWVDVAKDRGLPLPPAIPVGGDGTFRERYVLPVELAQIVDLGRSLEIVLGTAADLREITSEISNPEAEVGLNQLPERPGPAILSGRIPRA